MTEQPTQHPGESQMSAERTMSIREPRAAAATPVAPSVVEQHAPIHSAPHHDAQVGHDASAHAEYLADRSVLLGRISLPVPLYTAVFGTLGVLTIIEVLLAELTDGWFTLVLLAVLSLCKAALVVYFYMHLRDDNRLYALALIFPVIIAIIATMFLTAVPSTGY